MGALASRFIDSGNEWSTPWHIVMDAATALGIRSFDLDPAATAANAKADRFFTREQDGLRQAWFGTVWLNPPFSRPEAVCVEDCHRKTCAKRGGVHLSQPLHGSEDFARKVVEECQARRIEGLAWHGPVATDTGWFRNLWPWVHERIDYSGRVRYNEAASGGTFPSQTLIIRPKLRQMSYVPTRLLEARRGPVAIEAGRDD